MITGHSGTIEVADAPALRAVNRPPGLPPERPSGGWTSSRLVGTHSISMGGRRLDELCSWFRRPAGTAGPLAWAVLLIPEATDGVFRAPAEWLHVYHRVECWAPVPLQFDMTARVAWVSTQAGSVEAAITTVATADGRALAQSTTVLRGPGEAEPWGERALPKPPRSSAGRRHSSLVIPDRDVYAFASLAGMSYDVFQDARKAWALGYPNILVPSLLLFVTQMHAARVGDTGGLEMWFRQPVAAGSVLEFWNRQPPEVWTVNLVGGRVAAVARLPRSARG